MNTLLIKLAELEDLLKQGGQDTISEKYRWFVQNSEHGENCSTARKIDRLFTKNLYSKIKQKIEEITKQMEENSS